MSKILVDLLVEGTCKAEPQDTQEEVMDKVLGNLPTSVSGGPSVVAITSGDQRLLYDSGQRDDLPRLEESLRKIAPWRPEIVMCGHTHPDHPANNDQFKEAEWYFPINDDSFESVLSGKGKYAQWSQLYQQMMPQASRDFSKYKQLDPQKLPSDWPSGIEIIDTDGQMIGHQSLYLKGDITFRQIERGRVAKLDSLIIAGDAIMNLYYLGFHLLGMKKEGLYQLSFYEGDQKQVQDKKASEAIDRLLNMPKLGKTAIIFGHGRPIKIDKVIKSSNSP